MKKRFPQSILREATGNVLMMTALTMPALIGAAGLAIDTVQWTLMQKTMQREADSAALAGALSRAQNGNAINAAKQSLARYNLVKLTFPPVIENAPTAGIRKGDASAVRVVLTTQKVLPFSSMFMSQTPTISVVATAASITEGKYCVISLENAGVTGITVQGSASVELGCGVATNSPAAKAVVAGGSSYLAANPVAAVGGIPNSSSFAAGTLLLRNTLPQRDPFASLPTPKITSCSAQLSVAPNTTRQVTNPSGSSCYRGMDLRGTVNFAPGIYFVDGNSLTIGAQAVVTGTNVTFILTSSNAAGNPNSIANISINGGATVRLSATTTGPYAGVLVYQDRRASNSSSNTINGNSASMYQGAFYLPAQGVSFSGTAGMNTRCMQIVARRVTFIGNSRVDNECPENSGARAFDGSRVYLVE